MKKMKKALAALLAGTMVMSMSMTAWAEKTPTKIDGVEQEKPDEDFFEGTGSDDEDYYFTNQNEVTIKKTYKLTNEGTVSVSPEETLKFEITKESLTNQAGNVTFDTMPVPDDVTITYSEGAAGNKDKMTQEIKVTLPEYQGVGIYTYIIKEKSNDYAGVTYHTRDIRLVVTVGQGNDGLIRVAAVHTEEITEDGEKLPKSDSIENEYSAGTLIVEKLVTGNMGDQTKEFPVKVTFYAPEGKVVKSHMKYYVDGETKIVEPSKWLTDRGSVSFVVNLHHEESAIFSNIPYGVTYSVEELNVNDIKAEGYVDPTYQKSYSEKVTNDDGEITYNEVDETATTDSVTNEELDKPVEGVFITNEKNTGIDTGVVLDSMPYVLLLAVAAVGVFAFAAKKRDEEMF